MFPLQHSDHRGDARCTCPDTAELLAKLDRAGITYERVTLADVVESDLPLFFYPKDFEGGR